MDNLLLSRGIPPPNKQKKQAFTDADACNYPNPFHKPHYKPYMPIRRLI